MKKKYLIYIFVLLVVILLVYFIFIRGNRVSNESVYTDDLIKEEIGAMINSDKVSSKITSIMHGSKNINLLSYDISIVDGDILIKDNGNNEIRKSIDDDGFYKMVGYNELNNGYIYVLSDKGYVYYFNLLDKEIIKLNYSNIDELLVVDIFRTYLDTGKEESDKLVYLVSTGNFVEVKQ